MSTVGVTSSLVATGPAARGTSLANGPETPAQRKLRQAAGQFESMLLSDLWKSMKSSFDDDDGSSDDAGHSTMDEMGIEAMCSAVGKAGGLGIGKMILRYLEPKVNDSHFGTNGAAVAGTGVAKS